ncbi:hypothetical protein [Christiangramia aestuarii]
MIKKFLKAQHWQIFILVFALPFFLQILITISLFSSFNEGSAPDPSFLNWFKLFPLIMLLYLGTTLGWFWSVGNGLQKYIPDGINLKIKKFRIFLFIPVVYLLLIFLLFGVASYGFSSGSNAAGGTVGILLLFIIPLHLFSMFCMFYLLYFVSKTIKTVELKRSVTFSDFVGEFFMIWFFPIGVWFIQPRINKIISN